MNVLVKLPSRERPERLKTAVLAMINKATVRPSFLFAVDNDDKSIPYYWLNQYGGRIITGQRESKIEACNRGLKEWSQQFDKRMYPEWDIVVLASDDMLCQVHGWDEIIRKDMATHLPDTDGCLWYPDGHQENLCTLAVMGRKAFDQRGYIYHPSYFSLWCDMEWTEYWQAQGKLWKSDRTLFAHLHPGWKTAKTDRLYQRNNAFDKMDRENYERRKALGFPA